jgi:hypothetical protein
MNINAFMMFACIQDKEGEYIAQQLLLLKNSGYHHSELPNF